jgi:uncharacterized protein (DUF934 family)
MRFIPSTETLSALALNNTADVLAQANALHSQPALLLNFPKWTDGRAYSQAVLLRGRLKFTGDIVATGDVMVDMLPLLQRCGFSAVQLRADQNIESARRALGFFAQHYQTVPPERSAAGAVA